MGDFMAVCYNCYLVKFSIAAACLRRGVPEPCMRVGRGMQESLGMPRLYNAIILKINDKSRAMPRLYNTSSNILIPNF